MDLGARELLEEKEGIFLRGRTWDCGESTGPYLRLSLIWTVYLPSLSLVFSPKE